MYISDFKRSLTDKLSKNFFSEPSQVPMTQLHYTSTHNMTFLWPDHYLDNFSGGRHLTC